MLLTIIIIIIQTYSIHTYITIYIHSYGGQSSEGFLNEVLIEDSTASGITFKDFVEFIMILIKKAFHDEISEVGDEMIK